MSERFDPTVLAAAGAAQRAALQPQQQVWISANAGTGKTEVLTRRLVTLLLSEERCAPTAILALTFTNAGAAEMAARLPRKLTALQVLDDANLQLALAELGIVFTPATRSRLNDVVMLVGRQPPVIRTIHAFAGDLLRQFSAEARLLGIEPNFTLLDEAAAKRLLHAAQVRALSQVTAARREAVDLLLAELGEYGWQDLTRLTTRQWGKFSEILTHAGGEVLLVEQLAISLGLEQGKIPSAMPVPAENFWRRITPVKPVQAAWAGIITALAQDEPERLAALLEKFWCTEAGILRKQLVPKAVLEKDPMLAAELATAGEEFSGWLRDRAARQTLEITAALLGWGAAVQEAYTALKRAAGVVDYQDLLDAAEALLADENVLVALTKKFRHLLVDEAQDNNAQQARLVQRLSAELLAARGADGEGRTVLAVGDVKQSIYRFQGAQPAYFSDLRRQLQDFATPLADGRAGMAEVNLTHSFRSGPTVLKLVDAVFAAPELADVVTGEPTVAWPVHQSVAPARAGVIELWPLVPRAEKPEVAPWTLPMERAAQDAALRESDGITVCARQLATRLLEEIAAGAVVPSTGQALQPRDVLVLTQRNGSAERFRQVLRAQGLPVTGGRLTLETPALRDVVALLRVVQNPADRLSLAVVLKSPLMGDGWDDGAIMGLFRAGPASWEALAERDEEVYRQLAALRVQAGLNRPAVLVRWVWQALEVAARYARQPVEVAELTAAGEALVALAAETETLAALLVRLEDEDFVLEIGETDENAVRVMTTFKAKGLEAPLVVLVDTTQPLVDLSKEKLGWLEYDRQWRGVVVRLPGVAKELAIRTLIDGAEEQRQRADRLRQLYVALTRARDWLWVTGWEPHRGSAENWYGLIRDGLARLDEVRDVAGTRVLAEGEKLFAPRPPEDVAAEAIARVFVKPLQALAVPLWDDPAAPLELILPDRT